MLISMIGRLHWGDGVTGLAWPVVWTPAFEVGIPIIDEQHRRLVGIANAVSQLTGQGVAFERALEDMMAYTQYHFALEERLMRAASYPGLEAHRREHEALADHVGGLWRRRTVLVQTEVLELLTAWLVNHILTCDQGLRSLAGRPQ